MLFNINWANIHHREIKTFRQHNQQHSEIHLWKLGEPRVGYFVILYQNLLQVLPRNKVLWGHCSEKRCKKKKI